jgi:hypothetical protein
MRSTPLGQIQPLHEAGDLVLLPALGIAHAHGCTITVPVVHNVSFAHVLKGDGTDVELSLMMELHDH